MSMYCLHTHSFTEGKYTYWTSMCCKCMRVCASDPPRAFTTSRIKLIKEKYYDLIFNCALILANVPYRRCQIASHVSPDPGDKIRRE